MSARHLIRGVTPTLLLAGLATGCSSDGTSPTRAASVSVSITAAVEGAVGPGAVARDPDHALRIDRVGLVVDGVDLDGPDGAERLERGPFLLDVPLDGGVRSLIAATVPSGRYGAMRVQLRPPLSTEPGDLGLLGSHPDLEGISVRVEGRWDEAPFVYERGLDDVRLLSLDPPVEVVGRTVNVTLTLDVGSWFRGGDGVLVDPRDALGDVPLAFEVEERIRGSFSAFEDPDADGVAGGD